MVKKKAKKRPRKAAPQKSKKGDAHLRAELVALLKGGAAHVHFRDVIEHFPASKRGAFASGLAHTGWQLLEHARIAQWDILEFSRNPKHVSPDFPEGYWPASPVPRSEEEWTKSAQQFQNDLQSMIRLVEDPRKDLHAKIAHGQEQTILREALTLADHNSYHIAQIVDLRRALKIWPAT